jgi:hypothetical protein
MPEYKDFPSEYFHKFYYENVNYHALIDEKNTNIVEEMKVFEENIKNLLEKENLYPYKNNFKDYDISYEEILDGNKKCSVEHAIQFKIYIYEYTKLVMKLIDMSVVLNFDLCTLSFLQKRFREDFSAHYFINNYYNKYIDLDYFKKNKYFVITNWNMNELRN